jgi:hypothetical protein
MGGGGRGRGRGREGAQGRRGGGVGTFLRVRESRGLGGRPTWVPGNRWAAPPAMQQLRRYVNKYGLANKVLRVNNPRGGRGWRAVRG